MTAQLVFLALMGVVVAALLVFANRLHDLTGKLRESINDNRVQNDRLEATVDRMEAATKVVAANLALTMEDLVTAARQRLVQGETIDRMEAATHVVAENLADSVSRADATEGPDGAAADAALRTGDTAEAITNRQDRLR